RLTRPASDASDASGLTPPRSGREVRVQPGSGAFVYVGRGGSASGAPAYVVDSRGTANLVEGQHTLATLGLDDYDAPVIPDPWLEVLDQGTALSTALALCPPGSSGEKDGSCATAPK
ncbi:MAG: type VII secretion protein EccB, partial [Nocardioides sp.]|uniref:type VII secretion protein EccB n=1 Tax=Nocardioides sp. TaxID=35761 RepID=UPI0039E6B17E